MNSYGTNREVFRVWSGVGSPPDISQAIYEKLRYLNWFVAGVSLLSPSEYEQQNGSLPVEVYMNHGMPPGGYSEVSSPMVSQTAIDVTRQTAINLAGYAQLLVAGLEGVEWLSEGLEGQELTAIETYERLKDGRLVPQSVREGWNGLICQAAEALDFIIPDGAEDSRLMVFLVVFAGANLDGSTQYVTHRPRWKDDVGGPPLPPLPPPPEEPEELPEKPEKPEELPEKPEELPEKPEEPEDMGGPPLPPLPPEDKRLKKKLARVERERQLKARPVPIWPNKDSGIEWPTLAQYREQGFPAGMYARDYMAYHARFIEGYKPDYAVLHELTGLSLSGLRRIWSREVPK